MVCPACGAENREGARFCNDCGSPLAASVAAPTVEQADRAAPPDADAEPKVARVDRPPAPVPAIEQLPPRDPAELPPTHPEWRMSPAGPLPEQPKRRVWVWIVGALLFCVVMFLVMNVLMAGIMAPAA